MRMFKNIQRETHLWLKKTRAFPGGLVELHYTIIKRI